MCPVYVVPYNLPPWAWMDESNFMKDFDVDDLLELWKGVDAYDARTDKSFKLRAAVLWCIHDYLALSTLSGVKQKAIFHVFTVTGTLYHMARGAKLVVLGTTASFQRDIVCVETMSLSAYMKAMIHLVNSLKKS